MPTQRRVALVTGASSGIGAATTRRLARDPGTELVLVARRGELLAEPAGSLPCPATSIAVGLADADAPEQVRAHLGEHHDRLDLLVNNAGAAWRGTFAESGYSGAYSASKFALIGWTDALSLEEAAHGVHVGMVLPGFVPTEGFPATELRQKAVTRLILSSPEKVAEAILEAGPGGKAERYAPRPYVLAAISRILAPRLVRRVLGGGSAATLTPAAAERHD
jgi:short-subunit dehydrogenase